MAQFELNPIFTGIRGAVGSIVLYTRNGKTCARRYVVPRNPDTQAQRIRRNLFRQAMKSWQSLADNEKASYNRRASRLRMNGHNLYISRYMKIHGVRCLDDRPETSCKACLTQRTDMPAPLHAIIHSVTAPIPASNRPYAANSSRCYPPV